MDNLQTENCLVCGGQVPVGISHNQGMCTNVPTKALDYEWLYYKAQDEIAELKEELDIAIEVIENSGIDYDEATEHLRGQE